MIDSIFIFSARALSFDFFFTGGKLSIHCVVLIACNVKDSF